MNRTKFILIAGASFLTALAAASSLSDPRAWIGAAASAAIALKALITNPNTP